MKNKDSKTTVLRYVFYTLLTCVLCVGCADSPSLVEQIGKDVKSIQKEFEKGYTATDTIQGVELDEFIKDHSKYYKMVVWGSLDGVNYYCADTILVKDGEVMIFKGRAGNAR